MKLSVLMFWLASMCWSSPVTFSAAGAVSPIDDGWFLNIVNFGDGDPANRVATITANQPILSLSLFANNAPFSVGSGWKFYLDNVLVLDTGLGNLVQRTLEFVALAPFTEIRIETTYVSGYLERGMLTNFVGTGATKTSTTPEPATGLLGATIVAAVGLLRLRKRLR